MSFGFVNLPRIMVYMEIFTYPINYPHPKSLLQLINTSLRQVIIFQIVHESIKYILVTLLYIRFSEISIVFS